MGSLKDAEKFDEGDQVTLTVLSDRIANSCLGRMILPSFDRLSRIPQALHRVFGPEAEHQSFRKRSATGVQIKDPSTLH